MSSVPSTFASMIVGAFARASATTSSWPQGVSSGLGRGTVSASPKYSGRPRYSTTLARASSLPPTGTASSRSRMNASAGIDGILPHLRSSRMGLSNRHRTAVQGFSSAGTPVGDCEGAVIR
jgi:hypothetical protein